MYDVYPKFIINNNRLLIGHVDQHRELANDHTTTRGGGWWHIDEPTKTIWLYARSQLFGYSPKHLLAQIIKAGNHDYPGYTFFYSRELYLESALNNCEKLS